VGVDELRSCGFTLEKKCVSRSTEALERTTTTITLVYFIRSLDLEISGNLLSLIPAAEALRNALKVNRPFTRRVITCGHPSECNLAVLLEGGIPWHHYNSLSLVAPLEFQAL
jgi:hypothetical protein